MTAPISPAPGYQIPGPTSDFREIERSHQQRMADVTARAATMNQHMAANVVQQSSPDEAVTVTVTATGSLSAIRFGPKASTLTPPRLGETVMKTYRAAAAEAARRTVELVTEFAGADSPATKRLQDLLPKSEDDAR